MCGINGIIRDLSIPIDKDLFYKSTETMYRRGPDFQDVLFIKSYNKNLGLGHARLSIQDLTDAGNQPFFSQNKKFCIVFNGEIYNVSDLKKVLASRGFDKFISNSDTEILIELMNFFSLEEVLNMCEGMFAIAVYDFENQDLYLARDRAGEKPLYIISTNSCLGFASDIKAFNFIQDFDKIISRESVEAYIQLNYIPAPLSIYKQVYKLEAASLLKISLNKLTFRSSSSFEEFKLLNGIKHKKWWLINKDPDIKKISFEDAKDLTKQMLKASVKSQLISDKPLGAFLSGGIDSSLITSMMVENSNEVKTFNIGFDFNEYDESPFASKIASHLGSSHNTYLCSKNEAMSEIKNISSSFSEPFADSSQIPTMLVSKMAKQDITVALTGDAGDELFGGYYRYLYAKKYWNYINKIPKSIKSMISWNMDLLSKTLPERGIKRLNKLNKVSNKIKNINNKFEFYESMITEWDSSSGVMSFKNKEFKASLERDFNSINDTLVSTMMHMDFKNYLADDILVKVDRSSMFYSLETRAPFLNSKLINLAYSLPEKYKITKNETKIILKEILKEYVPSNLFERPKMGFGIPIGIWINQDLKFLGR